MTRPSIVTDPGIVIVALVIGEAHMLPAALTAVIPHTNAEIATVAAALLSAAFAISKALVGLPLPSVESPPRSILPLNGRWETGAAPWTKDGCAVPVAVPVPFDRGPVGSSVMQGLWALPPRQVVGSPTTER